MQFWLRLMLALLLLSLVSYQAFIVPLPEGYKAVVAHFGNPDRILEKSGAHFKWPWPIDNCYFFDCRNRIYNTRFTQTLTRDKKAVILLTYIVWNIKNPLVFLQSVGTVANAEDKIEGLVSSSKNNVLGNYDLANLVSTDPEQLKLAEIEGKILEAVAGRARESFGAEISSVGIKRLAYPENNVKAIFSQMRAERGQYAAKYRAEGRMQASIILSETDLEIAKINAEAIKTSAEIKGQADREATEIYAEAHKKGREFYKFNRSLEVLEKMVNENAVFILRSDQPPFNVLSETTGNEQ
ncbi:MAG: protease modulator HflC [Erysipelotrichia bacterium]|nr:protease modulator HflC [Erysipelotrichia bacterium]